MAWKTQINVEKLLDLSNPQSCYILGFLWADSYIYWKLNNVILEIITEDYESIQPVLASVGHWTVTNRTRINRKPQTRAQFSSSEVCTFLNKYNYSSKSGSSPILLQIIPKETQHYFFRGLFDGDGSFYVNKTNHLKQVNIAGSYEQDWSDIEKILSSLYVKYSLLRRSHKTKPHKNSIIRITGISNINKLGEYLYSGEQFGLLRKRNKYIEILQNAQRIPVMSSLL